jgi:hypothetical protein
MLSGIAAVLPPRGLPTKNLFFSIENNALHLALGYVAVLPLFGTRRPHS